MKTTLNKIRAQVPCGLDPRATPLTGFCKLRAHLGPNFDPNTEFSLEEVLDSNGLDDAIWCLRAVDGHDRTILLYAVWCARQVQHLNKDPRVSACIDVAERFANGAATDQERAAARAAAWDAARAAAWDAARDAAWAAARAAQEQELRRLCARIDEVEAA